jgi:hypothetical protein
LEGLNRIAERPQNPGYLTQTRYFRILAIEKGMASVLLRIVEGYALLKVLTGGT